MPTPGDNSRNVQWPPGDPRVAAELMVGLPWRLRRWLGLRPMRGWGLVRWCARAARPVAVAWAATLGGSIVGVAATATSAPTAAAAAEPGVPSAYVALADAQRLLDTRAAAPLAPHGVVSIAVAGSAPLPAIGELSAVVLNVTVVGPAAAGYWTVWPHDRAMPEASNVNVDDSAALLGARLALPNLVTVPVGPSGVVDVYASAGGHLLVDMVGYYRPATSAAAGRLLPLSTPSRVLDTRPDRVWYPGETRDVRIPGAAGAAAAVLNVTVIAFQPGYWTVFQAGAAQPATSNLNSLWSGHVGANQVIVPVDAGGDVSIFSFGGGHVIVDLVGTMTGPAATATTAGLFVPLPAPTRFLDSRIAALNPLGGTRRLLPGWSVEVPVASNAAIGRSDVAAVALNATLVESLAAGYVSVTTAGANPPTVRGRETSTLNATRAGQLLANHAIVPVSGRGFEVFAQSGGHVLADVAGFYLGSAAPAPYAAPPNVDPTPSGCAGYPVNVVSPLPRGIASIQVRKVQARLLELGFWNLGADGVVGLSTSQATMAFQKWAGIPATGFVDDVTATRLNNTLCRPSAGRATGDYFEVDLSKQIGMVVRGGQVFAVFNVSTGNGQSYDEEDQRNAGGRVIGVAITPVGEYRIYRQSNDPRYEGSLGTLYRPKFVVGGVAVHGARNVPNYPASHGCIRVSNPVMDFVWNADLLPIGARVWIHE